MRKIPLKSCVLMAYIVPQARVGGAVVVVASASVVILPWGYHRQCVCCLCSELGDMQDAKRQCLGCNKPSGCNRRAKLLLLAKWGRFIARAQSGVAAYHGPSATEHNCLGHLRATAENKINSVWEQMKSRDADFHLYCQKLYPNSWPTSVFSFDWKGEGCQEVKSSCYAPVSILH